MSSSLIEKIDGLVRRDPAGRGLISSESTHGVLCPGQLLKAAEHLAAQARHVGIVTGFFVPDGEPPAAETDGPPGAIVLAAALESIDVRSTLITDAHCAGALRAAGLAAGYDPASIAVCPDNAAAWIDAFLQDGAGKTLTHLIAIERVGPSHDEESLVSQPRPVPPPRDEFVAAVPAEHRNRCHNMRGIVIDDSTAPLHRLFEIAPQRHSRLKTIGIGDGGNEIGMGSIPWEQLARRLTRPQGAYTPCRIATDWTIIAGTSNWGGFALAAATLHLAGRVSLLAKIDEEFHRTVLERMVAQGPAVDGITRRREPTVDGLPFTTYIQTWAGICRLVALETR